MILVDASAAMNRQVFVIMTHNAAGDLPLGILLTTSSSRANFTAALRLYTELSPYDVFYTFHHIVDALNTSCAHEYHQAHHISINDSIVGFKGHNILVNYIRIKKHYNGGPRNTTLQTPLAISTKPYTIRLALW